MRTPYGAQQHSTMKAFRLMSTSLLELPRDLGNGLALRRSTLADAEPLADFNKMIFREPPATEPDEFVAAWTRDLLSGSHPTFGADDYTIVEESASGRIVSAMCLISQTWTYDGIPFGVGRPETVGTEPAYRKRGLVRAQFEVIHAISAARGEMMQAITGIPFYYRQFGYEMAMGLGGGRQGNAADVPKLKDGEIEPFRLRPVVEADLPFVLELDAHAARRNLVYCSRDESLWRYELWGKSEKNGDRLDWFIVETAVGAAVGLLGSAITMWGTRLGINYFELKPGVSWLQVAPSVLREVKTLGEALAARESKTLADLYFCLGEDHPICRVTSTRLPEVRRVYAWYLRVPDLLGFLRHITPVLERRLAGSVAAGHTGELKLNFYRNGMRLAFEAGRLAAIEPWEPAHADDGSAGFPGQTFLQLIFGYRSLDTLRNAFPDCRCDGDDARILLEALFPKQRSVFWPVA
jgi:Acetyltransferase (GNAT) domain